MENMRNEIERVVREFKVNKTRFFEVSKQSYKQILEKIEGAFVDKSKRWNEDIHWSNMGYYNPRLKCVDQLVEDWSTWMDELSKIISSEKPVYVLFEDVKANEPKYWLYESYLSELIFMLGEINVLDDFYIVSKKFDWLISLNHHDVISYVGDNLDIPNKHTR